MIKKNTLWIASAVVLMLSSYSEKSFSQTYQWANAAASEGFDYGNYITTDDSGNVYVSGQFEYDCNFGTKTISTHGQHDIFVAKYNSAGTLMWVKDAGGTDGDAGHGIGLDASRNIYTSGEFETTSHWSATDSLTVGGSNINNPYISKYDNNGNLVWVRAVSANGDSRGRALVTDPAGNSYFTGSFSRNAAFGSINISYTGNTDAFLAKYDKDGNAIWAKKAGGGGDDKGKGVALDGNGNIFLAATFTNSASVSGHTVTGVGKYDSFLAKYDTAGNYQWVVKAGGTDTTKMAGVTTDSDGNSYVTGYFVDTTNFGSTQLVSLGSYDFFIAKYDVNGNLVWTKRGGGANEDFGQGICFDRKSNLIYVTGQFDYMANFGGLAVTSAGNRDVFISCYDTSGTIQWIKTGGGVNRDAGYAVAVDTLGNIAATGFFDVSGAFGSFPVVGDSMADMFVTKISPPLSIQPSTASTNISSSISNCTDVTLNWTSGNGESRMVIAKAGSAVSVFPVDGNYYTANSAFGSGSYLGSGNYVVYSGSGNSCTITGLTAGTHYYFAVVEYNGSGVTTNYNTSSYLTTNVTANSFSVGASAAPAAICPGSSTVLTASGGVSYTWSPATGLSATTGTSVTATLNSSVTYTITATDGNGCNATTLLSVTVNALPTVTLSNLTDACVTETSVTLSGGSPAGGTYSGAFVSAGSFDPSSAGTGSHSITYSYTDGNGCSNSATASINVRALPTVTVSNQNAICISASPVALSGGSPSGGTYSGVGVSSGNFDPSVTGVGSQVITYSYTDGFGCANSATATIMVNDLPVVSLSTFNAVCASAASFALSGGSPAGGSYSGTGVVSGSFYANIAGTGTHTITYMYSDANGCSANASNDITVNALPVVTLGAFNAVCHNSGAVTLIGGSPAGGTYSGSGVAGGMFTPSVVGSNTIIYNYTDANGCANFATSSIFVNTLPTVTVSPFSAVCQNSAMFALTGGSPAGGTWTGSGVSAGNFYSTTTGNNTVIYNYTDGNGCTNHANTNIFVNTLPAVSFAQLTAVCVDAGQVTLTGGSPAGGTYSGTNVSAGIFTVTTTGAYSIQYSYTDGNGCSGNASSSLNVNPLPVVSLGADTTICMYNNIMLDAGAGFVTYLWNTSANTQTIFVDTTGTGIGTATFTVSVSNSFACTAQDDINVTFDICAGIAAASEQPPLGIAYPNPFCDEFSVITDAKEKGIVITFSDVFGNVILKKTLSSSSETIHPDVAAGIYFLRVEKGKTISTIKVVKTR